MNDACGEVNNECTICCVGVYSVCVLACIAHVHIHRGPWCVLLSVQQMPANQNSFFSSSKLDATSYMHANFKQPIDTMNASVGASPGFDPTDGAGAMRANNHPTHTHTYTHPIHFG